VIRGDSPRRRRSKLKNTINDRKTSWKRHKDVTVSKSLGEGINIINLLALQVSKKTENEDESNGSPICNGSVCLPEMFPLNLLTAMRAKTSFMFEHGPIRCLFPSKAPNGRKDFSSSRDRRTGTRLNGIGVKQIINFTYHILLKG
jgi:hypothetical protein